MFCQKITVFVIITAKHAKENYLNDISNKIKEWSARKNLLLVITLGFNRKWQICKSFLCQRQKAHLQKLKVTRAVPIYTYVTSRTSFTLHHLNAIVPLIFFTHTPTPLLLTFTQKKLPHPIYKVTFANLHNTFHLVF